MILSKGSEEMLQVNSRNPSNYDRIFLSNEDSISLEPLAEVRNSLMGGSNNVGMYSSLNRVNILSFSNVGVSSYISDCVIGRYTLIGSRVSCGGFEHPLDYLSTGAFQWGQSLDAWNLDNSNFDFDNNLKPVVKVTKLGNDVWIGNNSVILSGIEIGDGAVIGAGSVVTKSIPPFAIAVGNPAKVIRYRFNVETIEKLKIIGWWNLDLVELKGLDFTNVESSIEKLLTLIKKGSE